VKLIEVLDAREKAILPNIIILEQIFVKQGSGSEVGIWGFRYRLQRKF
jgi:hypothetical protein